MPTEPHLVLDKVEGAELEATKYLARYTRMGHIDDIDLADANDPEALVNVMPYLPPWNDPLSPNVTSLRLTRVRLFPQLEKFRRVRVALTYETIEANFQPTAYLLRDRTFVQQVHTMFIPGTRIPILMGFDGSGLTDKSLTIRKMPLWFDADIAVRTLQLSIIMYGRPDGGVGDYGNYVNDDDWPENDLVTFGNTTVTRVDLRTARSKPKGYWRIVGYSSDYDRQRGMSTIQAEAFTKNIEDWSIVAMQRHEKTGGYPFGSLSAGSQLYLLNFMNSLPYEYGMIYPATARNEVDQGLARFGPYPTTSFPALFGFGWLIPLMLTLSLWLCR